ncbi:MAG TPA: lantibiotic dehydratase [Ktedonobacteraceae bacterium]|nr:lantibiotic dehydratase [Ktedonobacteraceae bacterium]
MTHIPATPSPGSPLTVRVAGLPMESILPLRFTSTMGVIDELLARESKLQAQVESLSEALYHAIGAISDKKIVYQLLALRRAIYHVQMPKPLSSPAWEALPEEFASTIRIWLAEMERIQTLRMCGQETLETEWIEKRAMLQRITQQEIFQQGLVLASKDLYEDMVRWSQQDPGGTLRHDRQLELGLSTYLSRMATKTSPFSTFMSTGRGFWVENGPPLTCETHWQRRSAIALNWSIAQRIAAGVARWPEVRNALSLRVNSSLLEDVTSVCFLGWKDARMKQGETVMRLPNSRKMHDVLQIINRAPDPSYAAITRTIAQMYPPPEAAEVQRGLDQLIEFGLFELDLAIPDLSDDYLQQLLSSLHPFHSERVQAIALLLQKVQQSIQQYMATGQATERHMLRESIDTTLESIVQSTDLRKRGIATSAQYTFYENTLLEGGTIHCSLAHFQPALDDLALLQQVSALYDQHLPGRLAVAAFFADHYGPDAKINILRFYEDFCYEQAQPGGWRPGYRISGSHLTHLVANGAAYPPCNLAELEQIQHLQQEFLQTFVHQSTPYAQDGQLDVPALREFIARFPAFLSPPRSLAFSCQMLLRDGVPQLVLNAVRSGFGRSEGYLQWLETQVNASAPPSLAPHSQEDSEPLWTDILGVFGSNASLRRAQTPYELLYPGTVSARPSDRCFPLTDLDIIYDPSMNRLRLASRRLQRAILPVHLGLLDDSQQPPLYRFLLHVFSEGAVHPLLSLFHMPDIKGCGAELPVQEYPRLYLGKLVIRRATWMVGAQSLPKREKGSSSFEYMLKVQRWLVAHQIPQECFIRIPAAYTKDRKPLYIDFRNYLSVMLFEQMVKHTEQLANPVERVLLIQEVLPGREDLVLSDGQATYVSEFLLELGL